MTGVLPVVGFGFFLQFSSFAYAPTPHLDPLETGPSEIVHRFFFKIGWRCHGG